MRIESDNLILSFPRKRESSLNPSFTQTMDSRFRGNDGVWLTFLSNQDLICAAIVESTALVVKTVMINWEPEDEI